MAKMVCLFLLLMLIADCELLDDSNQWKGEIVWKIATTPTAFS